MAFENYQIYNVQEVVVLFSEALCLVFKNSFCYCLLQVSLWKMIDMVVTLFLFVFPMTCRKTSKINGIEYVPFMSVDLRERFAFPMPFS